MIWFHLSQRVGGLFLHAPLVLLSVFLHGLFPSSHERLAAPALRKPCSMWVAWMLFISHGVESCWSWWWSKIIHVADCSPNIIFSPLPVGSSCFFFELLETNLFKEQRRNWRQQQLFTHSWTLIGAGEKIIRVSVTVAIVNSFESCNMPGTVVKYFTCVTSLNPPGNSSYKWEYWEPEMLSTFSKVPQIVSNVATFHLTKKCEGFFIFIFAFPIQSNKPFCVLVI